MFTQNQKINIVSKLLKELGMTAASKDCNKTNYLTYAKWIVRDLCQHCIHAKALDPKDNPEIDINCDKIALVTKIYAMLAAQGLLPENPDLLYKYLGIQLNHFREMGYNVKAEHYFWDTKVAELI